MMNNLMVLSNDLDVITVEIKTYQRMAGEAIFEIGYRLQHVKENDLIHGEWIDWLKKIDMTPRTAQRFIQAYEQFKDTTTSSHLGTGKIFELISLPEEVDRKEFISQKHEIPSTKEKKTVDEMTIKELREVKEEVKKLKEQKRQLENNLKQEKNKPPKTETKIIEKKIDKTDYSQINKLKNELSDMQSKLDKIQQQKESYKEWAEMYKSDAEEYQRMKNEMDNLYAQKDDLSRQIESATSISGLVVEIEHMLQNKLAPVKYSRAISEQGNNQVVINNIEEILGRVESWCKEMRRIVPGSNIIDVI